jgi:Family of unknown function (DUF7033)
VLVVRHRDSYRAERAYTFAFVLGEFLGLTWTAEPRAFDGPVELVLADDPTRRLTIADALFATPPEEWLTPRSLPAPPLPRWDLAASGLAARLVEPTLPVLFADPPGVAAGADGQSLHLDLDVFGATFFSLTRYEEAVRGDRDEHGRFPPEATLAVADGFHDRPVVDEYVEVLRAAIARTWPRLELRRPQAGLRLSHDVDWPTHPRSSLPATIKAAAGDVIRRRDPSLALLRGRAQLARAAGRPDRDPYNTFEWIMERSEQAGLRSAFYFMTARTDPRFDSGYSLDDPWIRKLLRRIHARGHELGLHPSYGTLGRPELLLKERDMLLAACAELGIEQDDWGGRQHFLRWRNPDTWRAWADAELAYDSTLGYGRNPGFRCGTSHEYPAFDVVEQRPLPLRERPLIVMDMALTEGRGEHAGVVEHVRMLADRCRMFGGDFTLLWHNSQLASTRQQAQYVRVLSAAGEGAGSR